MTTVSVAATWSTQATPITVVAGGAMLVTGVLCLTHAALTLAHGGAPWGFPAYACLFLVACWLVLRLARQWRRPAVQLYWDASVGAFGVSGTATPLELTQVWRGPAWLTLALCPPGGSRRPLYLVVWKSSVSPPLWSELLLRIQTGGGGRKGHQNKENP